MKIERFLAFGLVCCHSLGLAQVRSMSGPIPAITFDGQSKTFRAVNGMLGFASLGASLTSSFDFGSVSPTGKLAIAVRDERCFLVSRFDSEVADADELSAPVRLPDGVAWSQNGSRAVLYSRQMNWIQSIDGLPDAPRISEPLDLSSFGSLTAVAVDTPGRRIAVGVAGEGGGVFQIFNGENLIRLFDMPQPGFLRYSSLSSKIFAWDKESSRVSLFDTSTNAWDDWTSESLQSVVGLHSTVDQDGQEMVWIARDSDQSLEAFSVASREVLIELRLDFKPTALESFGQNALLLATRQGEGQPVWVLSLYPEAKVHFVPAGSSEFRGDTVR